MHLFLTTVTNILVLRIPKKCELEQKFLVNKFVFRDEISDLLELM